MDEVHVFLGMARAEELAQVVVIARQCLYFCTSKARNKASIRLAHVFLGMARAEELAQVLEPELLPSLVQKYKY